MKQARFGFLKGVREILKILVAGATALGAQGCAMTVLATGDDAGDTGALPDTMHSIVTDVVDVIMGEEVGRFPVEYGPVASCENDQQCVAERGVGWYCNHRVCRPPVDAGPTSPCGSTCDPEQVCVVLPSATTGSCQAIPPACGSGQAACDCLTNDFCPASTTGRACGTIAGNFTLICED